MEHSGTGNDEREEEDDHAREVTHMGVGDLDGAVFECAGCVCRNVSWTCGYFRPLAAKGLCAAAHYRAAELGPLGGGLPAEDHTRARALHECQRRKSMMQIQFRN